MSAAHATSTSTLLLTSISLAALAIARPSYAQGPIDPDEPVTLSPITVVGTRTARRVDDVPATISVITAEQIEANLVNDIKDLIKFELGVSVPRSPARFTAALSGAGRDGNAAMATLIFALDPSNTLRLTYDYFDSERTGEALSSYSASVLRLTARDNTDRNRVSAEWRNTGALGLDSITASAFWQDSTTRQWTNEIRKTLPSRIRDVTFDNEVWGASAQGTKTMGHVQGFTHRITGGVDWTRTTQEGLRDGTVPPVGETFPLRAFPKTKYTLVGVFLQDEIGLLGGRLTIIPADRYDWYELAPQKDKLFPAASESQSESHVSPKIGAIYWANDHFGLFANYGAGFKSPSPMQVNNFFANPVYGYESIPNPDLKPETSNSIEAGMRFRRLAAFGGSLNLSATAFHSEYEDFIDQIIVRGSGIPGRDPSIYQYVNLTDVTIWGLEARGDIAWDNGWSVIVAASFADGEQDINGTTQKLTSIDPIKLVGGLNYHHPAGRWGAPLTTTWSDKKSNYECGGYPCWPGEAFTVVDLTAYWHLSEQATLRAGGFNLFDEKYAWWSDVRGLRRPELNAAPAVLDAYTQPGRHFGVSVSLKL